MSLFARLWSVIVVAMKHLFSQVGLTLATALGLITAVALVMSIPLYTDGVYYRVLSEGWAQPAGTDRPLTGARPTLPPFAFLFRYVGKPAEPRTWEQIVPLDDFLMRSAPAELGLPLQTAMRAFGTDNVQLFAEADAAYANSKEPLTWTSFGAITGFADHITLIEGVLPAVTGYDAGQPVEALIGEELATKLGLQPGETFVAFARRDGTSKQPQIPVRITGVWRATDPGDPYWFYSPATMGEQLMIPEESFLGRVATDLDEKAYLASWYLVLDTSAVHTGDVPGLVARINALQQNVSALLPGTTLGLSPVAPLQQYLRSSQLLTLLLYAFSVPIVGLLLGFVGLAVSLSVGARRNEIAVLRSRGATAPQVIGIVGVEALILGLVSLAAAAPLSRWIAQSIGRATSFLDFTGRPNLRVDMTPIIWRFGLVAILLILVAQIVPALGASRHTVVTYKQDRARSMQAPWWQRAWLDVLLLIPAAYGIYLLREQGSIAAPSLGDAFGSDPFRNPLLLLVPALVALAVTLLLLRFLPIIMSALAGLLSRSRGIGMLLATRHLSRSPGYYSSPLVLLVLTLSLSAFTASLAQTLDGHIYDRSFYRVGADLRIAEPGENATPINMSASAAPGAEVSTVEVEEEEFSGGPLWEFMPVADYLKMPDVTAATRVGRYTAGVELSGVLQGGVFLGVDRADFARAAFWRRDFSRQRLGALMNALAAEPNGVLIPEDVARRNGLRAGDTINLTVVTAGRRNPLPLKVVGTFDLFPTWYPQQDGPLFVGNLEHLFDEAGNQYPYEVWLSLVKGATAEGTLEAIQEANPLVSRWKVAAAELASERDRPERQGLLGFLSIGFIAAALLTVLGFLLYALFSFRQRFIELGILRAIGLSSGGMTAFLAWELAFLIVSGLALGTLLGVWTSQFFIPYLQVGSGPDVRIPPYEVQIAWPAIYRIWALFGALFVVALAVLAALLLRMRIFQAVKLGETA
jgi:putative ABC transport system permease protein